MKSKEGVFYITVTKHLEECKNICLAYENAIAEYSQCIVDILTFGSILPEHNKTEILVLRTLNRARKKYGGIK